jgi:simple sugar transport system permease protein
VGAVLIGSTGADPLLAYKTLFTGAFFDYYGFSDTLTKFSPIVLAGLALAIPLRSGLYNIGGEGQIYLGALFSAAVALYLPDFIPGSLHIIICIFAGVLGGAIWGVIPGFLKAYRGINEVITTLLMNYVGIFLISYFAGGPMLQQGAPYPYSPQIRKELWLPLLMPRTDAHVGALFGLALAVMVWLVLRYTTVGFILDTVGKNPAAARYAGINVRRQIVITMAVGGAIAGLAGTFEVIGLKYRLYHLFSPGYGFDGIVAAFLAGLNPTLVPVSALFLSGLKAGAQSMQRAAGLQSTVVEAIEGLVIIFVAASLAFKFDPIYWRRLLDRRKGLDEALAAEAEKNQPTDRA